MRIKTRVSGCEASKHHRFAYINKHTRCGIAIWKRSEFIQIHNHEWNQMRRRRRIGILGERARRNLNSTRNGNREPEIIPSSRRDSLVSLVCVFRTVREDYECWRAFRLCTWLCSEGPLSVFRFGLSVSGFSFFPFRLRLEPTSPATCWSIVINCLHDIPIVEQFVALLPRRKLRFLKLLEFIWRFTVFRMTIVKLWIVVLIVSFITINHV